MNLAYVLEKVSVPDKDDVSPGEPFKCENTDDFSVLACPSGPSVLDSVSSAQSHINPPFKWD